MNNDLSKNELINLAILSTVDKAKIMDVLSNVKQMRNRQEWNLYNNFCKSLNLKNNKLENLKSFMMFKKLQLV